MTEEKEMTVAGGIFAAMQLLKLGYDLMNDMISNPSMTPEEVAKRVEATKVTARKTVDEWRTWRQDRASSE